MGERGATKPPKNKHFCAFTTYFSKAKEPKKVLTTVVDMYRANLSHYLRRDSWNNLQKKFWAFFFFTAMG
jgi:hypothetical protein